MVLAMTDILTIDMDAATAFDHGSHTVDEIEDSDFRAVANPTRLVTLPINCTRGEAIQEVSRIIPQNELGLPTFYLRSDFLDLQRICQQGYINQDEADAAAEILDYTYGYPTFRSGAPFWERMAHEPHDAYILFQAFIELSETEGIRLLASVAERQNIPLQVVKNHSEEFYWSSRSRAYDLFITAAEAKKKEARTRKIENQHFLKAGEILEKVATRLTDDKLDNLDGKELLDAMEQMIKIQRLSVGLTGQNASTIDKNLQTPGTTVETIMRQLTINNGQETQNESSIKNRLALLMADEGTALKVQELVVKATTNA